ncbi:hypothetical protein A3762_17250, partial [Oleiphilus sp. HI0125]
LGDQNYPSFELSLILKRLKRQGQTAWCEHLEKELELDILLNEPFIPSHIALDGLSRVVEDQFLIGLGIHVASEYSLANFGILGTAFRHAPSLYDALEISHSYYELLGSFTDLTIIQDQEELTHRLVNVSGLSERLLHMIFELTIGGMQAVSREITGSPVKTRALKFVLKLTEADKAFYRSHFDCEIEDDAKFNEWVVDLAHLKQELTYAYRAKHELKDSIEQLNQLMQTLKDEFALVNKFDRLVRNDGDSYPNSKAIAEAMCMSERTFRRKLGKIGLNYNTLMGKIRCQIAIA